MSNSKLFDELGERIGNKETNKGKKGFVLLYKTKGEANVDEFHKVCDAKGPTLTVLYGVFNVVFGAYTSKSWSSPSKKQKVKDEMAFLFSMDDNVDKKCNFLPISKDKTDIAIMCCKTYGPTFGANTFGGYDLQTFKRGKNPESENKDGTLHLNGSMNVNNAYASDVEQPKIRPKDINSGRMIVKSLEVYQVTDDELKEPWLKKLEGDDFDKTKQKFVEMRPFSGLNIDHYNILLLGPIGAGKSSFINTVSAVFTNQVVQITPSRNEESSVTLKIKAYNIRTENGGKTKINLFDVPGFEDMKGYGNELEHLLNGTLPKSYRIPDEVKEEVLYEREEANPTLNDKIHFVCMVEGYPYCENYSDQLMERFVNIKTRISKIGLPLAVVATKFDLLCPNIAKDVEHIFKSPKAKEAVETISTFYGVQKNHVFPVVNYTDSESNKTKNQLALLAINEICKSIDGFLMHHDGNSLFECDLFMKIRTYTEPKCPHTFYRDSSVRTNITEIIT